MAGTPPLRDRLNFLHRLPTLLKGTSDDDVPCPGYLFEEIAKISHESLGSSQCLLEYLLNRLHSGSGRVKLKVLKIMLHLCGHGSPSFLLILKRNPTFIQEAAVFAGPPDPLHGNSLYQKVRAAAQDLGTALFSDTVSPLPPSQPPRALPPAATRHHPGQAGGGWDEPDSRPSSQNSSQENGNLSKVSDSGSRSGSDSPSRASWAPSDMAERVEAMTLSDCQQEWSLVRTVIQGSRAFLSREEAQHFVKECGLLNCEAVLELLIRHLGGTSECVQMRALGAIASLGCTDLLSQEHILLLTRPWLQELSAGSPGPVTNKATKILRHLEASCRQQPPAWRPPANPGPAAAHVGPSDLLTDVVPFTGGQAFLQPVSSALFSPKGPAHPPPLDGSLLPVPRDNREAKTRLAGSREQGPRSEWGPSGTDTTKGVPELGPGPSGCPWSPLASGGHNSLFAGMELVACPRLVGAGTATEEPLSATGVPWTLSQRVAAKEPPGSEPSAFAFLNS
ncbi:AP-4 complex accessory subunit tepsin isoform X4 [Diceros bicornis minor]|uniref:AP-4 complex accessory subunit tepsin isoform X4 n=1 Tax=Diceros bicornis minor TaxID=77932 RepID=UPI0026EE9488|nr:AP-4 complex accessory subunit tepsin isoform X4 [Diceros bicornis minor]